MNKQNLVDIIGKKSSYLCVGLDTFLGDIDFFSPNQPADWKKVVDFNKAIIDATAPHCVSYKINLAFYEVLGDAGLRAMEETKNYIGKDFFTIADAKRGDIGNTSQYYAKAFFESYNFDSITVAPYMGSDSVKPFLGFEDKWTILLALTSNAGSQDFQYQKLANGKFLFEEVLEKAQTWGCTDENSMFVVGATQADFFQTIRKIVPKHFLLVPGVGAQGGDLEAVSRYGMNSDIGLLVNMSRAIIFAEKTANFVNAAKKAAQEVHDLMRSYLDKYAK